MDLSIHGVYEMRLKKIAAATMWLPGFAPDEIDNPAPSQSAQVIQFPVAPQAPVAENIGDCWPMLEATTFQNLEGAVAKFDANIAAVETLRRLEDEKRSPNSVERESLNRYTGWGGLPQAFNLQQSDTAWAARAARLKALLTAGEWQSAFDSTPNAHYTSLEVVRAIWAAVKRLGFNGGRVIEPAAGVGYFLGAMPSAMAQRSEITAVEMDDISSRILDKLYGDKATIQHSAFEALPLPEEFFDLAISNVPFGNYPVTELRNVAYAKFLVHDYFFARSLSLLRPGGLLAFVTSAGTLDKQADEVRAYLATQADLVGAIRLPKSAFKVIANTEVTTDILFFQKRYAGKASKHAAPWASVKMLPTESPIHSAPNTYQSYLYQINEYFVSRPQDAIGKIELQRGPYGHKLACVFDGDLGAALDERIAHLPQDVYRPDERAPAAPVVQVSIPQGFHLVDGILYENTGDETRRIEAPNRTQQRVVGMIRIRDAARDLIHAQPATDDEALLAGYRLALNVAYDDFVRRHGFISERANRAAFKTDPAFPLLLSLEEWDSSNRTATKAAIFSRRTVGVTRQITSADSPAEALTISLLELGRVDGNRMAQLLGQPAKEILGELEDAGLIFLDPENRTWQTADEYLSGNVRRKLAAARVSGVRYSRNVQALETVIPKDLTPSEIGARIGSTWIPCSDYEAFLCHLLEAQSATVSYSDIAGAWNASCSSSTLYSVAATQRYGTKRINALDLFAQALNQSVPTISDPDPKDFKKRVVNQNETLAAREKQHEIREAFADWIWADDERASRLVRLYNDEFNNIVQRSYRGDHLTLPGFSRCVEPHPHQLNGIWRIVSSGLNTLLAHVVGAGKTLTSICAGMELRRLGKASKILYVVPNNMLEQFTREFLRAYPSARVLMATKDDLSGDSRRQFLARIATGDWDGILMTHASFERLKLSDAYLAEYIEAEIERITAAIANESDHRSNRIVKELARAKKHWEAKLARLAHPDKKDDMLEFEDLGIDWLMVDEAHLFKNLWRFSKMSRVAGLPNSNSERAFDMFVKTRHVMAKHHNRSGVVFLTGTPISNSMAELHVMQRYLQPRTLDALNLGNFDTWAANFGESVNALELAPDGSGYRMQTRFSRFINLPELMGIFRQVADIRTADMLKLPTPEVCAETVSVPASPELKAFVRTLVERAELIRNGMVSPKLDNMLAVTGDGRRAALDMRLVSGPAIDAGSKIEACVSRVFRIWQDTAADRLTQLVFCDMSTPRTDGGFSVYNHVRERLIARGVPASEIAFIHDYDSDSAKESLFAAVRAGTVRVLLGSTSKLGVGTNVQTLLVALHHLDAPWRPSDLEQREGRIIRQGNQNRLVYIFRYVTEQSFDAYIWQTLENKARFIAQIMRGDVSIRNAEDLELAALTYAEVKAIASGNPLVMEKAAVDAELAKLAVLKTQWSRLQWENRQELSGLPQRIAQIQDRIRTLRADIAAWGGCAGATVIVQGNAYRDLAAAADAINKATRRLADGATLEVGTVGPFAVRVTRSLFSGQRELSLVGHTLFRIPRHDSTLASLEAMFEGIEQLDSQVEDALAVQARYEARLEAIRLDLDKPFDKQERFAELTSRQAEIEALLDLDKDESGAIADNDDTYAEAA